MPVRARTSGHQWVACKFHLPIHVFLEVFYVSLCINSSFPWAEMKGILGSGVAIRPWLISRARSAEPLFWKDAHTCRVAHPKPS
jgi:hypothetical protein